MISFSKKRESLIYPLNPQEYVEKKVEKSVKLML